MKNLKESEAKGLAIFQNEDHRKALLASLVFIMLAILLMFLLSLEQPNPPLKPEVMEIVMDDFELEQGSQPAGGSSGQSEPGNPTPSTVRDDSPRPVQTQREETTPTPSGTGSGNRPTTTPRVDDGLTFPGGGSGAGSGSGSDFGDGNGVGGDGTGNTPGGGSYNPSRKMVGAPRFDSNAQEEGVIALDIWIDADGKVVKTEYNGANSSSGSQYLIGLAKKAALTMKYDKKPGAGTEKVGFKTFTFIKS